MNHHAVVLIALMAAIAAWQPAVANDTGWYAAVDLGQSHFSKGDVAPNVNNSDCSIGPPVPK